MNNKRTVELLEQAARYGRDKAAKLSRADDECERLLTRAAEVEKAAAQLRREGS